MATLANPDGTYKADVGGSSPSAPTRSGVVFAGRVRASPTDIPMDSSVASLGSPAVAGHKRSKDGSCRLVVEGPADPLTPKRRRVNRTVRAPNTKAGAKGRRPWARQGARRGVSAQGVANVGRDGGQARGTLGRAPPPWLGRALARPAAATLARVRSHIRPHIGDVALDRVRPVDIDQLYGTWRPSAWPKRRCGACTPSSTPHSSRACAGT
jgi:hypothetical protein